MNSFCVLALNVCLVVLCARDAIAATNFQEGFESGTLPAAWILSKTGDGRATVTTDFSPFAGEKHLVLDDAVSDASFSVSEATLQLDLTNKRNVVLSFRAKSLGNEPHVPPTGNFTNARSFDGVSISVDGGTTWRAIQTLADVGTSWETYSVTLDSFVAALGGSYAAGFRIRFSEYDNAPAPLDGIAIDEVSVNADDDQRVLLELPSTLLEGGEASTGYVLLGFAPSSPLTVQLSASPAGHLQIPSTVTVPAGETFAQFAVSATNDAVANFTRTVSVTATAPGAFASSSSITVHDDDVPAVTLTLPAELAEGASPSNNATLSLDRPAAVSVTLSLSANPAGELTMPAQVIIPAGQTQVIFTVRATNDIRIDGNLRVTVTAGGSGVASATAQVTTVDNETRALALVLPATVQEGGSATGTVSIPGTLTTPLEISLASADEAFLTVPAIITIPAGQTQATFVANAVENTSTDGSRSVQVAAANATFITANRTMIVRDNDAASYRFSALSDIVAITSPVSITVTAADVEGNAIPGYASQVSLSVVLPSGETQALAPGSVNVTGATGWSGTVTLPPLNVAPLRLKATDSSGRSGESTSFDIMRVIDLPANDIAWDSARGRIYASIPATAPGTYANKVVTINPETAQVTGSVTTGQDPGQFALTSGGENLYVALNGNGTIAKINPATLVVASSFPVGTDPSYGTLYAQDISAVSGQPNLLVVSQYRKSVSPSHNGVAVYDNGVIRPTKTRDHTGSNIIEPSADPTVFFGYNTESTEYGFRRLQLSSAGITELEVNRSLISGFYIDMRSDGDKVFSTTGVAVDGPQMRRLGSFGVTGIVRPDLAANRVYFVEPTQSYSSTFDKVSAYDPTTFSMIRRLTISPSVTSPSSFIRWGANGLAFRTSSSIVLINSRQLVPSDPPADLLTTVRAMPNPATVGSPLTYTVQVTNQGPNVARNTLIGATLSESQTIQSFTSNVGSATNTGSAISLPVGDLAAGATATLTITTSPLSAGSLSCSASANSSSIDVNFSNNVAFKLVSVAFEAGMDAVNQLRLNANNLLYDATRKLLWATIPATADAPLGRSVVSINPTTGLISDPLPINADPREGAIALSANGRYLYIGLTDSPEVHRVDLSSSPPTSARIPLGNSQWGSANYAQDIEVLQGDGTTILIAGSDDHAAAVYDGMVRRATRTGIYTVDRIEPTGTADVFIGYNNYTSGFDLSRLTISSSGVSASQTAGSVISGYYVEISGREDLLLSSTGRLVDSNNLSLRANLGVAGRPCLDAANRRAYVVDGNTLRAFDATNYAAAGTLSLPVTSTGDWAKACVRWGPDGFAILGNNGKIYIARWSGTIPLGADTNGNGIADSWEARAFSTLDADLTADPDDDGVPSALEYMLGTPPFISSANSLELSLIRSSPSDAENNFRASAADDNATLLRITHPKRRGLPGGFYRYEVSADLINWSMAQNVTETVRSTAMRDGEQIDLVEAVIPSPARKVGFVRIKWLRP